MSVPVRGTQTRSKEAAFVGLFRLVLSILVPPLAVFLQAGLGRQFLLNVLLTALGYFPGLIHAVWLIFSRR